MDVWLPDDTTHRLFDAVTRVLQPNQNCFALSVSTKAVINPTPFSLSVNISNVLVHAREDPWSIALLPNHRGTYETLVYNHTQHIDTPKLEAFASLNLPLIHFSSGSAGPGLEYVDTMHPFMMLPLSRYFVNWTQPMVVPVEDVQRLRSEYERLYKSLPLLDLSNPIVTLHWHLNETKTEDMAAWLLQKKKFDVTIAIVLELNLLVSDTQILIKD